MKELWLFTRTYPEGTGEAFLADALPVWTNMYDRVLVIPMFAASGEVPLPPGAELFRPWADAFRTIGITQSIGESPRLWRLLAQRSGAGSPALALSHVRQLMYKRDAIIQQLMPRYDPDRVAVLSTWMEDWVNVLALVKERDPRLRIATMAHGSDLYAERHTHGRIAFRARQMEWVDRVLCISRHGANYLHERYPKQAHKVVTAHLGTTDHGPAPWSPQETLRVVSCAYLRKPKRVDLLARALALVKRPVHWTHFGDGPDRERVVALVNALPPHITVEWKGQVPAAAITAWYKTRAADLLVHLSGHEGVPVALMEAASFGIPLLANDVGGVGELLTPQAGMLLPAAVDAHTVAAWIDGPEVDRWKTPQARTGVRQHWERHFAAHRNFKRIAQLLPGSLDGAV